MDERLPRPPAHVEPYLRLLGPDRAVAFLLEFGGQRLYLPKRPGGTGPAAALLGADGMEALCSMRPGGVIRVPTCRRWLSHALSAKGSPVSEIARKLRVTDVMVWKYLREAPDDSSGPRPGDGRLF